MVSLLRYLPLAKLLVLDDCHAIVLSGAVPRLSVTASPRLTSRICGRAPPVAGYRSETSRDLQDSVVGLMRPVLNRRIDVLTFEEGVVGQDFIVACAVGQEFEDVRHTYSLAANAGTAAAFAFFDGDSF
jgi:hypothetical protein